jgi:hypothetical protein
MMEMSLSPSEIARRLAGTGARCSANSRAPGAPTLATGRTAPGAAPGRACCVARGSCAHLRVHVEDRLAMGWSPDQIAGRMELGGPERRVSAESIYRHAYSRVGQGAGLPRLLAQHKPKRGRRRNGHCEHTQYGGGIHGRDCSDRGRSGEGGVPASWGHGSRDASVPQEAVASAVSSVHVETSALPRRDGSLRLGTRLGPRDGGALPLGPADPADLREAVCEASEERCRRCGGHRRSVSASDHAVRAGEDGQAAVPSDGVRDPRPARPAAPPDHQCAPGGI